MLNFGTYQAKFPDLTTCDRTTPLLMRIPIPQHLWDRHDFSGRVNDISSCSHVDICGQVVPQLNRADLGCIGGGECLEDSLVIEGAVTSQYGSES